jgi:hypothetical protein
MHIHTETIAVFAWSTNKKYDSTLGTGSKKAKIRPRRKGGSEDKDDKEDKWRNVV